MAAYLIARIDVANMEEYMKYASQTNAIAAKFGGKYLVKGGDPVYIEGEGPSRYAVVEFPDRQAAIDWQNSDEYRAVVSIRHANSTGDVVVVDGI